MLRICLIHATSPVRPQPKDTSKVYVYVKERFMLSYYSEKIRFWANGSLFFLLPFLLISGKCSYIYIKNEEVARQAVHYLHVFSCSQLLSVGANKNCNCKLIETVFT